ncbi:MAG: LacI family DNA-binding transcriptional regulator [Nocardioides sp.]
MAREAGVSRGAVSFALNDRPGVADATRDRIRAVASELGFTPSHRARALSASRALTVGLVIARQPETLSADPFFPAFIAGVEKAIATRGQALLLQVVPDQDSERASYETLAANGRVDGVFLTDLRVDDPRPALLASLGLPAVVIAPTPVEGPWPVVAVDDRPGIAAAVDHLMELGHRRIAHVGGPMEFVHSRSRQMAWADALAGAGLDESPCVWSDFSPSGGARATQELLDLADPPTAIVFANDLMAIAGAASAQERGLRVPEDLSVTGFDDTAISGYLRPPLTTVRTDAVAWGSAAAECLLSLVDGGTAPDVQLPPPQLIRRASTAPPARTSTGTTTGTDLA